jgi:hypothetical protein
VSSGRPLHAPYELPGRVPDQRCFFCSTALGMSTSLACKVASVRLAKRSVGCGSLSESSGLFQPWRLASSAPSPTDTIAICALSLARRVDSSPVQFVLPLYVRGPSAGAFQDIDRGMRLSHAVLLFPLLACCASGKLLSVAPVHPRPCRPATLAAAVAATCRGATPCCSGGAAMVRLRLLREEQLHVPQPEGSGWFGSQGGATVRSLDGEPFRGCWRALPAGP